jgi:hypothetical protein
MSGFVAGIATVAIAVVPVVRVSRVPASWRTARWPTIGRSDPRRSHASSEHENHAAQTICPASVGDEASRLRQLTLD